MTLFQKLLAVFIPFIFGCHFFVMKLGMQELDPLLYLNARFLLVSFPLIFFVKKPKVPWPYIVLSGIMMGGFHHLFLLYAIDSGLSSGLSSLLLQSHVFFTVVLCSIMFRTRIKRNELVGLCVAFAGILFLTFDKEAFLPNRGVVLMVISSLAYAYANIIYKQIKNDYDPFAFSVWTSLVSAGVITAMSVYVYGYETLFNRLLNSSAQTLLCLSYTSFIVTLFGMSCWAYLCRHCSPDKIAPYSMLMPLFGLTSCAYFLGEPLTTKIIGALCLILFGVLINQSKWSALLMRRKLWTFLWKKLIVRKLLWKNYAH